MNISNGIDIVNREIARESLKDIQGYELTKTQVGDITIENVSKWLSRIKGKKKLAITDEALALIKMTMEDPTYDAYKFTDSLITYQDVLQGDNTYSLVDYVNALRYVGYLQVADGNHTQAYIKAFSHREFVRDRLGFASDSKEMQEIRQASIRYRKSKLVVHLLAQADVPLYLMFQAHRYKAVAVLAKEMENAPLAKDRIAAADRLLTHVKPPENIQVELGFSKETTDNVVNQYEAMLVGLIQRQRDLIANGESLDKVANVDNYIDVDFTEKV